MNILYISSDNNKSSGAFLCMVKLVTYLKSMEEIDNVIVLLPKNGDGEYLLKQNNIPYLKIRAFSWIIPKGYSIQCLIKKILKISLQIYNMIAERRIRKVIKKYDIDLVHLNTIFAGYGAKAAQKENVKYVWHIRELLDENFDSKIINTKKGFRIINGAEAVITVSQNVTEAYKSNLNLKKVIQIYDGVTINDYYIKNKHIFQNKHIQFLMIGNIAEYKGQMLLIQAIKQIKIPFHVTFVGSADKKYMRYLEKEIDKIGISSQISFIGKVDNVIDYLRKSDILFMCSKREAFGRVTVEGLLSGNLVIGADSGCTPEIIQHKKTGLLFKNGDYESLYGCILYAINNRKQAIRIAQEGQRMAKERFSDIKNAILVKKVYQEIFK